MIRLITLLIVFISSSFSFSQTAKIEYIAHAAFILESEQGTRILIDPYHSYNQMGYTFPEGIAVDAVLITHAHYDHDATKYVGVHTPVFRKAGHYQVGDITFYGIAGKHAYYDRILMSGSPAAYNTMWVIKIGNMQLAHLGDTAVPTPEELEKLSAVDIIIGHPNDEILALFPDKTYIPNHYLLPQVTTHKNWMQPIDGWLEGKENVILLDRNTLRLNRDHSAGVLVFQPAPSVKEWTPEYYEALGYIKEGLDRFRESKNSNDAISFMDKAIVTMPHIFEPYLRKARLLNQEKQYKAAIATLENGFARVPDIDWGRESQAHILLFNAYTALDEKESAYQQYLWLEKHKTIVNSKAFATVQEQMEQD